MKSRKTYSHSPFTSGAKSKNFSPKKSFKERLEMAEPVKLSIMDKSFEEKRQEEVKESLEI